MENSLPTCSLKIDVDTLEGYLTGVPLLLDVLGDLGIKATFCVAMGPDHSGRAVRRVFTKRGFLAKMLRTKAVSMYGMKTLMYGTLLPGPRIAAAKPQLLHDILAAGHELIPHGWDHVDWHDFLSKWNLERTREHLQLAANEMERLTSQPVRAFASPGWQATANSMQVQQELGFLYAADTRGWRPFFPTAGERVFTVLQLPTTLPTLDEFISAEMTRDDVLRLMLERTLKPPQPLHDQADVEDPHPAHVYTLHAELEGRDWADWFRDYLISLQGHGVTFPTMAELAQQVIARGDVPIYQVKDGDLPGRAGYVACQEMV
ncbi:MAG: polysaccharide deacetylase family protein [Armatimonadota bacterium]